MKKVNTFQKISILFLFLLLAISGCSPEQDKKENSKAGNNLTLGASAADLLGDHKFTSMVIEVAFVPGFEPSAGALEELKSFLNTYTHKPDGISIVKTAIDIEEEGPYTISEIAEIEKEYRTYYNDGKELAIFIFFANGRSEAEETNKVILGTAYRNTSLVIFEKTIRHMASESIFISKNEITSTTLKHEFGHLFGLVDNGSPAQTEHMDSSSASHCNVDGCLMVATVEFGKGALEYIKRRQNRSSSHEFGSKCLQDLLANGGK